MKKFFFFFIFFLLSSIAFSQDDNTDTLITDKTVKGFHLGITIGSCFANQYTSALYDGYGYDLNGNKNNFATSFMNTRINYDYGGGYGQTDQIAAALNVNHGDWSFGEDDMPKKIKYTPSVVLGLDTRYAFDKKNSILLNVSATKLSLTGDFTISLNTTPVGYQQPGYINYQTFAITGGEQRLVFQMGYQRMLGNNDIINFFVEGGGTLTMTKFMKNQITINNLTIDVSTYYYSFPAYNEFKAKNLQGIGLGAFGGFGCNFNLSAKSSLQLVYDPSMETIKIGVDPKMKVQNYIGLRAYYNL